MPVDKGSLIQYRLQRANETIKESEDDISKNYLHSAENRIYYAIFYSVMALALKHDFATSKHKNLMGWFNKNFIKTGIIEKEYGDIYREALENRIEGDYEDLKTFSIGEVNLDYSNMIKFVKRIEELIIK